ncbi:MAG: elongation factor Ts [Lachnospiraceae bacterium]|nr:elongation factor Ts [Lachnospiraceae bacterium]MBP3296608.1 elongation factor Ts [Lachnospiraceae bacterium]
MAAITAAMVKELREMSGAGMMECKKALTETDGDMDAAVEVLKKSGAMKAEKKASRIAAEGLCAVAKAEDGKTAAVVEVNSETDFVAKNEKFKEFVSRVAAQALQSSSADMDGFMEEKWIDDNAKTVKEALNDMVLTIGEKLDIRRFKKVQSAGLVESYIHGGGKIAVIVEADGDDKPEVREAMKNIAMQVAAMSPQYVQRSDISDEAMAKMKEIVIDSSLNEPDTLPKPILQKLLEKAVSEKLWSEEDIKAYEEQKNNKYLFNFLSDAAKATLAAEAMKNKDAYLADKIFGGLVEGRISKQVKEICLFDQVYVKAEDGKQTVKAYVEEVAKKTGTAFAIKSVIRFETGEGIQKKEENFAEEVAKQMNG